MNEYDARPSVRPDSMLFGGAAGASETGGNGVTLDLTENAVEVLRNRYLKRGKNGQPAETPEDLFRRVARTVAAAESAYGLSTVGQKEVERVGDHTAKVQLYPLCDKDWRARLEIIQQGEEGDNDGDEAGDR